MDKDTAPPGTLRDLSALSHATENDGPLSVALRPVFGSLAASTIGANTAIEIRYTNYRGEFTRRRILPHSIWFGTSQWHPEPQWFMHAIDTEKREPRDFALKDMIFGGTTP